jgi:molecular chaperone DnaK
MGRDFHDLEVQYIIKNNVVSYKIVNDPKEPDSIRVALLDNLYTPEAVSSVILKKLINDSKLDLGGEIEQAVVTVPAYFSDRQKFATRAACQQAGLKLLRLLSEPTAAALSFGLKNINSQDLKTIMVFDLGGGTFDISVLSLAGGSFMEITKGGDMWLGGDNIDQMLVDHVFKQVEKTLNGTSIHDLINKLSYIDQLHFLIEIKETPMII